MPLLNKLSYKMLCKVCYIQCNNYPYKLIYNCLNKSCNQNCHHLSHHYQGTCLFHNMMYYICHSKHSCNYLHMKRVPKLHLLYIHFHMRWYIVQNMRYIHCPNHRRHRNLHRPLHHNQKGLWGQLLQVRQVVIFA